MCKWWAAVFILSLILWNRASPQPVTENIENDRQIRETNKECCPCPTGTAKADDIQPAATADSAADQQKSADDCPCMVTAGDPEASASALVPNTDRPLSSSVRPGEPKNDVKPLLHPEVDLASSVLNTLREATDEEYEEAKGRDAARSSTKSEEPDISIARELTGDPNKNIVNIFIKTKDSNRDTLSEASNLQETRCSPDDDISNISKAREATSEPPSILERLIGAPKFDIGSKRYVTNQDSSIDSSNVRTSILDFNGNSDRFKIKSSPLITNFFSNGILRTDDSLSGKNALDANKLGVKLRSFDTLKQSETIQKITESLRSPLTQTKLVPNQNQILKNDLNLSSSITSENVDKTNKNNDFLKSKETIGSKNNNELKLSNENTMPLKSVLQLTDIKLFPANKLIPSIATGKSGLTPKLSDLFKDSNKKEVGKNVIEYLDKKLGKSNSNVQVIPKNRPHTEILDTVTSPSDNNPIISDDICRNEDTLKNSLSTHSSPLLNNVINNYEKTLTSSENYSDEENEDGVPGTSKHNVLAEQMYDEEDKILKSSSELNNNTGKKDSRETEDDVERNFDLKHVIPESHITRGKSKNSDEKFSLFKQSKLSNLNEEVANDGTSTPLSNINENSMKFVNSEKSIELEDLQKLSDTMLNASSKTGKQNNIQDKTSSSESNSFDQDFKNENEEGTTFDDSVESIDPLNKEFDIDIMATDTCASNLNTKSAAVENTNEMDVGASEPRLSRLSIPNLRSTANDLIQSLNNAILEPSSIIDSDPLNIFRSPSIINLPSVEDIGTRLSNIFRLGEDRIVSSEIDFGNSNANPIISKSRLGFGKTVSPNLKPLDDINLNSFQIKPVTLKSSDPKIQFPGINLNSYKTRLSLPKSLDIQPLQLESALGNKAGIFKASVKGSPSKSNTATKLKSKSPGKSNLRNPKLNLSERKLDTSRRNSLRVPLSSTLSLSSTTGGLKSRAEEAVRNVKASLDSTLNENRINLLGDPLNSQNILQAVASTHDDVQTKLKALHSDFSDRLSSLHSNIFDQTRIPSLRLSHSPIQGKSRSSFSSQSIKSTQSSLPNEPTTFETPKPMSSRRELQKNVGRSESVTDNLKFRTTKIRKPIKLELPTATSMMAPRLTLPDISKPKLAMRLENNQSGQKPDKSRDSITNSVRKPKLSTLRAFETSPLFDSNSKSSPAILSNNDKERSSKLPLKLKLSRDTFDSPSEVRQIRVLSPIRISSKSAISDDDLIEPNNTPTPPRPPTLKQELGVKTGLKAKILGLKPPLVINETKQYEPKSAIENYESISAPTDSSLTSRKSLLRQPKERSDTLLALALPRQELNMKESLLTKTRDTSQIGNNNMRLRMTENGETSSNIPFNDNLKENVNYKCKMVCSKDFL